MILPSQSLRELAEKAALDLEALKRAAEKIPCKEWISARMEPQTASFSSGEPYSLWVHGAGPRLVAVNKSVCMHADDMDFMALACPATILQLIARLEASERELHAIAYYTEPHYRGAGLEPKADWIIKELASRAFERDDEIEYADRYRWLRKAKSIEADPTPSAPWCVRHVNDKQGRANVPIFESALDAAIDAQIAARKE